MRGDPLVYEASMRMGCLLFLLPALGCFLGVVAGFALVMQLLRLNWL